MDWIKLKITSAITVAMVLGTICCMFLLIFLFDSNFFMTIDFWRLCSLALGIVFPIIFANSVFLGITDVHPPGPFSQEERDKANMLAIATCAMMTNGLLVGLIMLKYIFAISMNFAFITTLCFEGVCFIISIGVYKTRKKRIDQSTNT